MDSAHCDERNLAHSAAGRNLTKSVESLEIANLKEEHEKQIQKLTFENRIKILELEKEMSKQDKEQKMKILQLEKDNQSLTHELELLNLKAVHGLDLKKVTTDHELEKEMLKHQKEFQNRLAEKDKELVEKQKELANMHFECKTKVDEMEKVFLTKEHEYQMKLAAKENESQIKLIAKEKEYQVALAAKENEFMLKMKDLEHASKIKLEKKEREKESAIQALRHKIELMETTKDNDLKDPKPVDAPGALLKLPEELIVTKEDKLIWGADEFFRGIKTGSNLFPSYEIWYEAISGLLTNKKQECVRRGKRQYFFVRKEMKEYERLLYFATKRENDSHDYFNGIVIVYPNSKELRNTKLFLLHPKQRDLCISGVSFEDGGFCSEEEWTFSGVTESHHYGKYKSIIFFLLSVTT